MVMLIVTICLASFATTNVHSLAFGVGPITPKSLKTRKNSVSLNNIINAASLDGSANRRDWMKNNAASLLSIMVVTGADIATPTPATAEEEEEEMVPEKVSRMGGQLEKFQDGSRGFRMLAPSGWNKFEGEVGAYDVMWRDLVDVKENIKISTIPVKSTTTSVALLGDVQTLGEALAKKRNASLVNATARTTDGILFYNFEFAINDGTHQMLQMCVGKSKLWSLDLNSSEKRWEKKAEMYKNVANSFIPKLG
jgi:photosystem II oxygen-evolving enhancer protein 2